MKNPFRRPRGMWADVDALTSWLDANATESPRWWWSPGRRRTAREHELTLRIAKCSEELGEVVDARIRALGQNPRKGKTATGQDVATELCDVVVTALVALTTQVGGVDAARAHLNTRFTVVRDRVSG
ncbi:MazG-like family protein [Actinomadura sp. 3N407]|uniref:MazG-like family protein n=1 Tax=Actinomadura sp. 3N407 TaxID=3457423 RepID=UPI003FCD453B